MLHIAMCSLISGRHVWAVQLSSCSAARIASAIKENIYVYTGWIALRNFTPELRRRIIVSGLIKPGESTHVPLSKVVARPCALADSAFSTIGVCSISPLA